MLLKFFNYPIKFLMLYGYGALFVWSVLEGEIGLMLAGWMASEHLVFSYQKIILVATIGALLGDIATFSFGRLFKKKARFWLEKHPDKKVQVQKFIDRYGEYVIVFERFVYGTHIPVLLTFGMSGYSFLKFLFFDLIGVIVWAVTFVSIGYYFGKEAVSLILLVQKNVVVVLFFLALFLILWKKQNQGD